LLISKNTLDNGELSGPHSFDAGSAWENIALQSTSMGLIAHAMGGIDRNLIKKELEVSDDYTIEVIIAIGKPGNVEDLPEELKSREKPSDRKNLEEISFEGIFKN
jgi:nitroreductase